MRMMLSGQRAGLLAGEVFLYFTLVLCFGSVEPSACAQEIEVLSRKPPVLRRYDPKRDETAIITLLYDAQSPEITGRPSLGPEGYRPSLSMQKAGYSYPGRSPARPQSVSFTFTAGFKPKGVVDFSLSAEGMVVHQGEASQIGQLLTVAVPTDVFLRIARAKKVEFKLGPKSHKLKDYQRERLAALASMIGEIGG